MVDDGAGIGQECPGDGPVNARGEDDDSAKTGKLQSLRGQSINQAKPATSQSAPSPPTVKPTVPVKSGDSIPRMPVMVDARDEDLDFSDDGESIVSQERSGRGAGGKAPRGRHGGSNHHLSAHAVYARMNRERKKTYLAELEQYKTVVAKKTMEKQRELEDIQRETDALTREIGSLRSELAGNNNLMSLLNMGRR